MPTDALSGGLGLDGNANHSQHWVGLIWPGMMTGAAQIQNMVPTISA